MPSEEDIQNLRGWCKENGVVDMKLLRAITGMQHGRGMPSEEDIQNLRSAINQ